MAFPKLNFRRKQPVRSETVPLLLAPPRAAPVSGLPLHVPEPPPEQAYQLYDALRYAVPVIDAAIRKVVRLTGGFRLTAEDPAAQALLDRFADYVPVNAAGMSLQLFADQMLDSLLTYGNAFGEMLPDENGTPSALLTAHPGCVRAEADPECGCRFSVRTENGFVPLRYPERILFAAIDPPSGAVNGVSVLRGLPAVSQILLRIYECIGQNYDRAGNIRYAVTYHPDSDSAAFAKEHAQQIAETWQQGIRAAEYGDIQDFVAVGDIGIKVIGAENQLFDTNVPVRQLLEQIVAKLSIPPFLLGLSWSTTERMSAQQADILTSELEYFRRVLTPVLRRIGTAVLHGAGFASEPEICWDTINLQDETELANARLRNAQAEEIELRNRKNQAEQSC